MTAGALLDRIVHRCHIVNIRGNSYRLRRHAELSKAINPTAARRSVPRNRAREGGDMGNQVPREPPLRSALSPRRLPGCVQISQSDQSDGRPSGQYPGIELGKEGT